MPSYTSGAASGPEYVPVGEYEVEVIGAKEKRSGNQNDMIELKLVTPEGAIFFDHLVFNEKCAWKIDAFRGATGETVTEGEDVNLEASDLIGRKGMARLTIEEFDGRKSNKVGAWLAPTDGIPF